MNLLYCRFMSVQHAQVKQLRRPMGSGPRPNALGKIVPHLWYDKEAKAFRGA